MIKVLIVEILLLLWLLISSCSQTPVAAPSTASVQGSISSAKRYNDVAVTSNAKAQTNVERIEAKAGVIEKFWK